MKQIRNPADVPSAKKIPLAGRLPASWKDLIDAFPAERKEVPTAQVQRLSPQEFSKIIASIHSDAEEAQVLTFKMLGENAKNIHQDDLHILLQLLFESEHPYAMISAVKIIMQMELSEEGQDTLFKQAIQIIRENVGYWEYAETKMVFCEIRETLPKSYETLISSIQIHASGFETSLDGIEFVLSSQTDNKELLLEARERLENILKLKISPGVETELRAVGLIKLFPKEQQIDLIKLAMNSKFIEVMLEALETRMKIAEEAQKQEISETVNKSAKYYLKKNYKTLKDFRSSNLLAFTLTIAIMSALYSFLFFQALAIFGTNLSSLSSFPLQIILSSAAVSSAYLTIKFPDKADKKKESEKITKDIPNFSRGLAAISRALDSVPEQFRSEEVIALLGKTRDELDAVQKKLGVKA